MSKKINRTGERYSNNEGDKFTIIECFGANDCTIQFECGGILKKVRFGNIKKGSVDNPFKPTVCGVGYKGVGKYKETINSKPTIYYAKWNSMINRCYSNEAINKTPTYQCVTVCEEWKCFQIFAEWWHQNWKPHMNNTWQLDKDILVKGSKKYSPETCDFVPQELNLLFTTSKMGRALPLGVYPSGKNFIAAITIDKEYFYLGTANSPEKTFPFFKHAKEKYLKKVANEWKPLLSERIYKAMINYQVEITD